MPPNHLQHSGARWGSQNNMSGWAAAAAAAADVGGKLVGHQLGKDWERKKMTHGYQWAVGDLRKAGLNPMLAYTQGPAKASGMGGLDMGTIGSSALSAYKDSEQARLHRANVELTHSAKALNKAKETESKTNSARNLAAINKTNQEIANLRGQLGGILSDNKRKGFFGDLFHDGSSIVKGVKESVERSSSTALEGAKAIPDALNQMFKDIEHWYEDQRQKARKRKKSGIGVKFKNDKNWYSGD